MQNAWLVGEGRTKGRRLLGCWAGSAAAPPVSSPLLSDCPFPGPPAALQDVELRLSTELHWSRNAVPPGPVLLVASAAAAADSYPCAHVYMCSRRVFLLSQFCSPHQIVTWSMLFGAVISWGIMWPLINQKVRAGLCLQGELALHAWVLAARRQRRRRRQQQQKLQKRWQRQHLSVSACLSQFACPSFMAAGRGLVSCGPVLNRLPRPVWIQDELLRCLPSLLVMHAPCHLPALSAAHRAASLRSVNGYAGTVLESRCE